MNKNKIKLGDVINTPAVKQDAGNISIYLFLCIPLNISIDH